MYWVLTNGKNASDSNVGPIDAFIPKNVFYPLLVDEVSYDGAMYAVPMDIHRINSLFFNRAVFTQLGIPEPWEGMSLTEFNDLCQSIHDKNSDIYPLAVGNLLKWTLQELIFEIILPAVAGADYYEAFWQGNKDPSDSEITETLNEALLLLQYFNPDWNDIDWQPALDKVMSGEAAMTAFGDWTKGYFESFGKKSDVDFGVVQFPGTPNTFVYTVDSFPLPIKDTPGHALAAQLLETFASAESQVAFNHKKGSIPARSDIVLTDYPDEFDAMHLRTYQAFQSSRRTLALSGLLPTGLLADLGAAVQTSWALGTSTILQTYLKNNYGSLQQQLQQQ